MNTLKYHHLFAKRGEEEDREAPGEYWQDKATPRRRLSASPQPHDAIPPAPPAPKPHTELQQPTPPETPTPEYQMDMLCFYEHPYPLPNEPQVRLTAGRGEPATAEGYAVGEKGGVATRLAGDADDTSGTQPAPKHHGSQTRQVHQVSGYLTDPEFAEVERLRGTGTNQLTRGAVVTKLIRTGLKVVLDNQHAEMLEPRLEQTMTRLFEAFVNRFMRVISETYYTAKAGDIKLTDLMSLAYGDNTADFHKKIADAEKEARLSLTRRNAVGKPAPEEEGEEKARQAEE